MKRQGTLAAVIALPALVLGACATYPPSGPTSPAYIGDGKTQADFAQADAACRDLAQQRTGLAPGEAAAQSTAGSALLGTLLGAGIGAGIGAAAGNPALGAAIGAGVGLAGGAAHGAAAAPFSAGAFQERYDVEYYHCMYAAGHKVPAAMAPAVSGGMPPAPGPAVSSPPPSDPTRGQLQNATPWPIQVFIDQDPGRLNSASAIALGPNEVRPQNLDIGPHRVIADAVVETQFGTRPVGRLDRSIQVDPRGAGWSLRFSAADFR